MFSPCIYSELLQGLDSVSKLSGTLNEYTPHIRLVRWMLDDRSPPFLNLSNGFCVRGG